jgi:hypothetical protein
MPTTAAEPRAALLSPARSPDLLTPARAAGWANAGACLVPEVHAGDVMLRLGSQRIPVRQLTHGPDVAGQLERVADSLLPAFFPEQFLVLHGFSDEQLVAVRRKLHRHGYRFLVGNMAEYLKWLKARLGPLGGMPHDSPVRALAEPLLCFIRNSEPATREPVHGDHSRSKISESYKRGQKGVQAFETILAHRVSRHKFTNVENVRDWQRRDVDLLVQCCIGGQLERLIKTELKTEKYTSGYLSLEDIGNLTKGTPGWLHFSECDVLVSIAWPAGEAYMMNFAKIKEWALSGKHGMRKAEGRATGQTYKSSFYLAPIDTLLQMPETVVLRIQDFLPNLYRNEFPHASLVKKRFASRILVPQSPEFKP